MDDIPPFHKACTAGGAAHDDTREELHSAGIATSYNNKNNNNNKSNYNKNNNDNNNKNKNNKQRRSGRGRGAKQAVRMELRAHYKSAFLAALDAELVAEWTETQDRLQQCSVGELQAAGVCVAGVFARQDSSVFRYGP